MDFLAGMMPYDWTGRSAHRRGTFKLNYYYYFLMNEKLKYRYQVNVADVNIYVYYKLLQPK